MTFDITAAQLGTFAPHLDALKVHELVSAVNETMDRFNISDSVTRVRYFMAQAYFETEGFTRWEEDLNYSTPERLVAVWPSRFSMVENAPGKEYAPDFVNNPERLANIVYAGRGGNGDTLSGDGYAYRGRGMFDLTFINNYRAASIFLYNDPTVYLDNPDLVSGFADAALTAGWFWHTNDLNSAADSNGFTVCTQRINGSTATVPQRLPVLTRANAAFIW